MPTLTKQLLTILLMPQLPHLHGSSLQKEDLFQIIMDHALLNWPGQTITKGPNPASLKITLGPLFKDRQFQLIFRIPWSVYETINRAAIYSEIEFYSISKQDSLICGKKPVALDAKLLVALKLLAYGAPSHAYIDYFQMSPSTARRSEKHFCDLIIQSFKAHYLHSPNKTDVQKIENRYYQVHGSMGVWEAWTAPIGHGRIVQWHFKVPIVGKAAKSQR